MEGTLRYRDLVEAPTNLLPPDSILMNLLLGKNTQGQSNTMELLDDGMFSRGPVVKLQSNAQLKLLQCVLKLRCLRGNYDDK